MLGEIKRITYNNRSLINPFKKPIFHVLHEVGVEIEVDIVKSCDICIVEVIIDKFNVLHAVYLIEPSAKTDSKGIDVIAYGLS